MIKCCYKTHIGNKRDSNEDRGCVPDTVNFGLIAVADGMGGHKCGEKASDIAIHSISRLKKENTALDDILRAMISVNEEILEMSLTDDKYSGMGTTLTCAFLTSDEILIGHIGDSRAYLFSGNKLTQLTTDHTYVAELQRAGLIDEAQARTHKYRNVITRCCGVSIDFEPELKKCGWEESDIILVCSDGLHSELNDKQIFDILSADGSIESRADSLINLALSHGGDDNITAVLSQNEEENP